MTEEYKKQILKDKYNDMAKFTSKIVPLLIGSSLLYNAGVKNFNELPQATKEYRIKTEQLESLVKLSEDYKNTIRADSTVTEFNKAYNKDYFKNIDSLISENNKEIKALEESPEYKQFKFDKLKIETTAGLGAILMISSLFIGNYFRKKE